MTEQSFSVYLATVNGTGVRTVLSLMNYHPRLVTPTCGKSQTVSAHKFIGCSDTRVILVAPIDTKEVSDVTFHKNIVYLGLLTNLIPKGAKLDIFGTVNVRGEISGWVSHVYGQTPVELQLPVQEALKLLPVTTFSDK